MKALFSEDYYRINWSKFLEFVPGEDFVDMEHELGVKMQVYDGCIPDEAVEMIRHYEAKKIADMVLELVQREARIVRDVEKGKAGFGYTTERQEIEARGRFRKRFEFNCLQLRDFKEKYGV